ncbi:hypothetical protein BDR26DRAFT_934822 [Obelidium mucronatum]|nr:hypothetical protein BDR26DRAFT_934822 [Obelidium mucronatum]
MQLSAADDPDDNDDEEGNENKRLRATGGKIKDSEYFPTVRDLLGLPPTSPPPSSSSAVKPATISTPVQSLVYTKPVVKAAKAFTSDLRLHELICFKDENTGLMKLIVYLPILTTLSSDGKTLTYYIQPAETNP